MPQSDRHQFCWKCRTDPAFVYTKIDPCQNIRVKTQDGSHLIMGADINDCDICMAADAAVRLTWMVRKSKTYAGDYHLRPRLLSSAFYNHDKHSSHVNTIPVVNTGIIDW